MEDYHKIVKHYESCLKKYGDNNLGVDWPNKEDAITRYHVMLDVIKFSNNGSQKVSLLDFGCGTAMLHEYLCQNQLNYIEYSGLDISEQYVQVAKNKFPQTTFYKKDILKEDNLPMFDYIVMNGVFTEKRELSFDAMMLYFQKMISVIYKHANKGVAFNVMSKHVDWERDDLFHLPFDTLAEFLKKEISSNFIIRYDYGLYEYTVYVYKNATL